MVIKKVLVWKLGAEKLVQDNVDKILDSMQKGWFLAEKSYITTVCIDKGAFSENPINKDINMESEL